MKPVASRPPGFLENFRAHPLLFIGSALGLLAMAWWKGERRVRKG